MQAESLGLLVAFSAGLLSFLSPCVLPLVPSYATFITGMTVDQLAAERASARTQRAVLLHGLLFVAGFSTVFLLLGASATLLGSLLHWASRGVEIAGGVLLVGFGLALLGALRVPGLGREWRFHLGSDRPLGRAGSFLVGVTFGAGWTPCIGPVLGGILTLAATRASLAEGMGLLAVYSAGLAIPFLLSALLLGRFLSAFRRVRPLLPWVERASGALLVGVGILFLSGTFATLSALLAGWTPAALLRHL